MFTAIEMSLDTSVQLVNQLTQEQYCDQSARPYHSSIGIHVRHVLDIYNCICIGMATGEINLAIRARETCVECNRQDGLAAIEKTRTAIKTLKPSDLDQIISVTDDFGCGPYTYRSTLIGILAQAQSHATHHFASIGYILTELGIDIPNAGFGLNPTTPIKKTSLKIVG